MTILSHLYAGNDTQVVLIPTLEIKHASFGSILTCAGYEDQTVTLEDGSTVVTFLASALDISLPARNDSGQQNLVFAIENVTGIAQDAIDQAMEAGGTIEVIYRSYLSSDMSEPAEPPLRMTLVGAQFEGATLQVTASYMEIINQAWPRSRYTVDFAPGLKYIS